MSWVLAFVVSLGVSALFCKFTIQLAKKFKVVDDPRKRNHPALLHTKIIPRAGGLPIFLAFAVSVFFFVGISKELVGILFGGAILVTVGILDDKYDLKTIYKFAAQLLAAIIVVASGVGISYITNPFVVFFSHGADVSSVIRLDELRIIFNFLGTHSIVVLADLFALFWIVWVINMVNFSSGVDGQLPGIAIVSLMVIFAASLRFYPQDQNQLIVSYLSLVGAGATLGFLFFNFSPAKIFPGDSASYFLGFLIAVLAILSGAKVGAALLVMAVPLIDGVFTAIRRVLEKKSPFAGDRKHLHHRLLELGLSQSQVALFYWLLCAILGAVALILPATQKLIVGVFIAIIVLGGIVWLNFNLPTKVQK